MPEDKSIHFIVCSILHYGRFSMVSISTTSISFRIRCVVMLNADPEANDFLNLLSTDHYHCYQLLSVCPLRV